MLNSHYVITFGLTENNNILIKNLLSQIREHLGITTDQLSQKINRNSLTVKRYIEVLRVMGEKMEYNPQTKGWKIQNE